MSQRSRDREIRPQTDLCRRDCYLVEQNRFQSGYWRVKEKIKFCGSESFFSVNPRSGDCHISTKSEQQLNFSS